MTSFFQRPDAPRFPSLWKPRDAHRPPWPWAMLIALALAAQGALIWTHAPWADELQATALARESHALADWYWNFRYEGHAPLWHLLLKIPLAFTDDTTALRIVQSAAALCGAALLHLRAPFGPGVKLLLSLNYFLFFEYGVIARDYSLTVLFFFAAIAFRRQPVAWLFIALLPQGGLQSVLLAGICGLIVLREQGWRWGGVVLAGCGGVVALVWMWPAPDFEALDTLRLASPWHERLLLAVYRHGATLLPLDFDLQLTGWELSKSAGLITLAGLCAPALAVGMIWRQSRFLALLTGLFLLANLAFSLHVYTFNARHFGLWNVLVIGLLWVTHKPGQTLGRLAQIWLVLLALGGLGAGVQQAMRPFSAAPQAMAALREAGAATRLIIPVNVLLGAEVNGLLRLPTFDMTGGCMQSFVRWRRPIFMGPSWIALDPERRKGDLAGSALAAMKAAAARAGGQALLLLDDEVGDLMAGIDDPALTQLRFFAQGASRRQWRHIFALDVPPDPNSVPIPPCIR